MKTQKSFYEQNGGTYTQVGDVRPSERSFKRNSQYAKALDELVKAGDALTNTLTEKQKEIFEDYMTAQREVNVLTDCETFLYARFFLLQSHFCLPRDARLSLGWRSMVVLSAIRPKVMEKPFCLSKLSIRLQYIYHLAGTARQLGAYLHLPVSL